MSALHKKSTAFGRTVRLLPLLICGAFAGVSAFAASAATEQWVPGRLLVQPKPGLSDVELNKILKQHGGKSVGKIEGIGVHIVQLPPNASEKAVAALLSKNPHLKFAERDLILKPAGATDDPYFASAWHLAKINAPQAWDSSNGSDVVIAILDSGVDGAHPDLFGKLVAGWNFVDNNADTSDVFGHGTLVAGAAAASSNNGVGVASVAGGASIMPIRVTDTSGNGSLTAIASGLIWAADRGARVANLSFYGPSASSTVLNAAQYMKNKGGLVTESAGNYGTEAPFTTTDSMIVVSGTNSGDVRTSWSSYGAYVDLAAPGEGIWTTARGGGYSAVSGTSFSAPITAGTLALVMAANPSLSAGQIEQLLFSTAVDLGSAGWDAYYGFGRIDASAAVQAAMTTKVTDLDAPNVSITSPTSGGSVSGLVSVAVNANDNVGVTKVELVANGKLVGTDIGSPYGFSWDSRTVPDGNVTITAYGYDAAGNYSSSSAIVRVSNAATVADGVAPTVDFITPIGGSKVAGTTSVTGAASDNVGVTTMKLYVDGILKAQSTTGSISYNWNTRKYGNGNHSLRLEALDAAGNMAAQSVDVVK